LIKEKDNPDGKEEQDSTSSGGLSLSSRKNALESLEQLSVFFETSDPHSPATYLLKRDQTRIYSYIKRKQKIETKMEGEASDIWG
jgi:hypothetical protein